VGIISDLGYLYEFALMIMKQYRDYDYDGDGSLDLMGIDGDSLG